MPGKILMVEGNDQGHFVLVVEGDTLTVGITPTRAEAIMHGVHIKRIHCEIELEDDAVVVGDIVATDADSPLELELVAGNSLQLAHAQLHLESAVSAAADDIATPDAAPALQELPSERAGLATDDATIVDEAPTLDDLRTDGAARAASEPSATARKRFVIVDGPDKGRAHLVPDTGPIYIGKSARHAEIILHDLFVSRVHCELQIDGDTLVILHVEGDGGTLVNGQKIAGPRELVVGDIVRIGNSYLKLETTVEKPEEIPEVEAEVVEEPGPAVEAPKTRSSIEEIAALEGQTLGHFHLEQALGRGHSGVVFRAEDKEAKRLVALKVLAADFPASQAELEHFVKAMKVAARLHHPNLLFLHGAGRTGRHCWIAREYVEGGSVNWLIRRSHEEGQFKWKRAGRLAVHLARALIFLEKRGVSHRCITPHNVLVREEDKMTKLADVMLEEGLTGSRPREAVLERKTADELPYLAPEQLQLASSVDLRADLYSVGAVLYHLLTGQAPYTGDSAAEILDHLRATKLAKPSTLQSSIPDDFEAVVLRLLAQSPQDRFQTAAELLAEAEPIALEHQIKL
ncbi:MAG: FHA domain-containing protein [Planctomycetes bacterium]|nr:FHA domain-containing protein [Planctomycetota bacterium]